MQQSKTELESGAGFNHSMAIEFNIRDNNIWFSQKCLSRFLRSTSQNINIHFRGLKKSKVPIEQKAFLLSQKEGGRTIRRKIQHIGVRTAIGIALRANRYKEHEQLLLLAKEHHVQLDTIPISAVKERAFSEMLFGIFHDILEIEPQVRIGRYTVDFHIPSLKIAVEYDESHHAKPANIGKDVFRQLQIEAGTGLRFIRIKEGEEYKGLNEILRALRTSEANQIPSERGSND